MKLATSAAQPLSLFQLGADKIRKLCRILGFGAADEQKILRVFEELAVPWGKDPASSPARWASDITDDHSPFEFSLAIDGGEPEIRFLIEVQGDEPSIASNWEAARAATERLAQTHGVDLNRFETIVDIFTPTAECRRFTLWHAVCFRRGAEPDFKVYLNPQAKGPGNTRRLVEEAMARLGFGPNTVHLPADRAVDDVCYFSLDLSARKEARVKVYTAHYGATLARIESALAQASSYTYGRVSEFCKAMGDTRGTYLHRPVLTCLAFVEGRTRPTTGTVHFPIRSYVKTDAEARDRVVRYIHAEGAPAYIKALDAFADRDLADGVGMQTYTSLRLERGRKRLTVYLAPEIYDVGQVAITEPRSSGVISSRSGPISSPLSSRRAMTGA